MNNVSNFWQLPLELGDQEIFEPLLSLDNMKIERIISTGQTTPPGEWYDQSLAEWVILLQGEASVSYRDGSTVELKSGDYVFIPPHQEHRVEYTSSKPPCIWLAIHIKTETKSEIY